MKKIVSGLIVTVVLLLGMFNGYADIPFFVENKDFSIRGGIHYGISEGEIVAIETANGSKKYEVDTFYGEGKYDLSFATRLLGYEATVTYWIDDVIEPGTLDEFQYMVVEDDAYMAIKASLTNKYGNPMCTKQSIIFGTGIDKISNNLSYFDHVERDYAGWIIQYNDCYLMIEMKHIYFTFSGGVSLYNINYDIVSPEEMELMQMAYMDLENYVNESYENDL